MGFFLNNKPVNPQQYRLKCLSISSQSIIPERQDQSMTFLDFILFWLFQAVIHGRAENHFHLSLSDFAVHLPETIPRTMFPITCPFLYTLANSLPPMNNDCKRLPF